VRVYKTKHCHAEYASIDEQKV